MNWYTADLHLGHKNIIKYCNRPFDTVEEMDAIIIDRWNSIVSNIDNIYVLGDFTLSGVEQAEKYVKRLSGKIQIIPGSHDRWLKHATGFVKVLPPLVTISDPASNLPIILCHYAMRTWDRSHYGSIQLFGHSHGTLVQIGSRQYDVGVDNNDFYPISIKEIFKYLIIEDNY